MVLLIRSTHRFQSTLPVRGATRQLARRPDLGGNFNPRSPCGERQMFSPAPCGASGYFNPRSPCGERLACRVPFISPPSVFQSTLPVRGATTWTGEGQLAYQIFQSTLPVRGATMTIPPSPWLPTAFQSTLPVRGATAMVAAGIFHRAISIHAPRAGSDSKFAKTCSQ